MKNVRDYSVQVWRRMEEIQHCWWSITLSIASGRNSTDAANKTTKSMAVHVHVYTHWSTRKKETKTEEEQKKKKLTSPTLDFCGIISMFEAKGKSVCLIEGVEK